jgi:hypothetical protein
MSFRRPKIRRQSSSASPTKSTSEPSRSSSPSKSTPHLYLVDSAGGSRRQRSYRSKHLYLPGPENLLTLPGWLEYTHSVTRRSRKHARVRADTEPPAFLTEAEESNDPPFASSIHTTHAGDSCAGRTSKREREWTNWSIVVIPSLVHPFMRLLYETRSLRDAYPVTGDRYNGCMTSVRHLKILCVHFECESCRLCKDIFYQLY